MDDSQFVITKEDLIFSWDPLPGHVVAQGNDLYIVLDTAVTPELLVEGAAREVAHEVNGIRKKMGLGVSDLVEIEWASDSALAESVFSEFANFLLEECRAVDITRRSLPEYGPGSVALCVLPAYGESASGTSVLKLERSNGQDK